MWSSKKKLVLAKMKANFGEMCLWMAELVQAQGTQHRYEFVHSGWVIGEWTEITTIHII